MNNFKKKSFRLLLVFGLLVLLPIAATLFTLKQTTDDLVELEINEIAEQLANKSELIAGSVHSEAFLKPIFNKFARKYFELDEDNISTLNRISKEIEKEAGVKIDVFVFNSAGKLIPTDLYPPDAGEMAQYMWVAMNGQNADEFDYGKLKPQLQKYFGRNFSSNWLIKQKNKIGNYVANNKQGMVFHSRNKSGSQDQMRGIILLVRDLPNHNDILEKSLENFDHKDLSLAILLGRNPSKLIVRKNEKASFENILRIMDEQKQNTLLYDGKIWKKTNVADFSIIAGQYSNHSSFRILNRVAYLIAILLAVLSFLVSYKHFFSEKKLWISIRLKLVLVFIFAIYLPLLGLFYISFKGLQDRQTVLVNAARKGMLDVLYKLDSDFSIKEEEILAKLNQLVADHTWQTKLSGDWTTDDRLLRERARTPIEGDSFFNWLELRNNKLEQVFCTARGAANDRIKALNKVMAQICLEKFVPEILAPETKKIRQSDFIIRNIIENPVLGFNHFFEVPGELVPMVFEGSYLYWYWNYYKNPQGDVVFLSCNSKAQFNAKDYLQKMLKNRFFLGNTQLQLISFDPNDQKWIPQNYENEESVLNLTRLCALNNRITSTWIEMNGEKFLATCFPGIKIKDVFLTCLYPTAEINSKIDILRWQIFMGMILILVIAILTGLLLTRTFLKPVGELNSGLQALHQRQTDFRVNISNKDEFGELGETFNQMMVEVKEMLLAGAVQQCLIPTVPPEIPGFQLVIFNQMATDVGGDYADAFLLPENKFLLVLGDVTGHGISSSILTAMVKALVFRFSQNPTDLSIILKQLSEMIFDLLKHRKLMTFCAIIVDQNSGQFSLANAGHPYPIICSSDGKTRKIEHSSLPLGVSRKRSNYPLIEGNLQPGDTFVMYTDGIAEAADKNGNMFGFDRVESIISANSANHSEQLKVSLLDQFWDHYTQQNLDDDLTFVILKREIETVSKSS